MQIAPEDIQELRFTVVKGSNPGSKISFDPTPRQIRIGRSVESDIVVADPSVSRNHARVDIRADRYTIVDAGSSAGLEKMGFRVGNTPEALLSGDEFKLGDTILRFEVVAKKGALKRAAAREAGPAKPSPVANVVAMLQRALSTIGLRTPLTQAIAGVCFLLLVVIGLWPAPPTIPPQAYGSLPIDYNAVWGYNGFDRSHADGAVFDVPQDAEGIGVYVKILPGAGIELRAGERVLTKLEAGGDWQSYSVLLLPRAIARTSSPHLILDHLGYAPADGDVPPDAVPDWGVGRMWIVRVAEAASSPGRVAEDVTALRELHGRVTDDPAARYNLVKGLRTALVGLMKLSGRPAVSYAIPPNVAGKDFDAQMASALVEIKERRLDRAIDRLLPALQIADIELTREHTKLANTLALLQKKGSGSDIAQLVPRILKMIPDPTDVRHRDALEVSRTLQGKDLEAFQDLMSSS
jgi:FHA domain